MILFVKIAWKELLQAKISLLILYTARLLVIAVLAIFGHQGAPLITQPKLTDS